MYSAGQSFADRNGRGAKKNKNLVIGLDLSAPVARLRENAIEATVFNGRISNGRNSGISLTSVENIIDLSTAEQMILNVCSGGKFKSEHIKLHHAEAFQPYVIEFFKLVSEQFRVPWEVTAKKQDTYRRLYVHGWAFCLKALALAYHQVRIDKLGPIVEACEKEKSSDNARLHDAEAFKKSIEIAELDRQDRLNQYRVSTGHDKKPAVDLKEFKNRLSKIDWMRHRRHWIAITGCAVKEGKKKTYKLKDSRETVVVPLSQNTPAVISATMDKILSDSWADLTKGEDELLALSTDLTKGDDGPPR